MHILWFTNCLIEQGSRAFGLRQANPGGGWMGAMLAALQRRQPEWQYTVATSESVSEICRACEGNTQYLRFPIRDALSSAVRLARECAADVIHIHGSEYFYGLVATERDLTPRCVLSMQGLVGPCSTWPAFFGNLAPWEVLRVHRISELCTGHGLLRTYFGFVRNRKREEKILRALQHCMGRTGFDRSYALGVNPAIQYHHVGELLREPFWSRQWDLQRCDRHSIIFTNAGHPRKGVEVLLAAFEIVKRRFPDAVLRVAGAIPNGTGYGGYIGQTLERVRGVEFLGVLDAGQMADALTRSHIFVSPSFIDNSPNAVCEAQLLGMPVLATYVGGVPSLVEDRRSGLLTTVGDPYSLAARIIGLLSDDALAMECGRGARELAMSRHSEDRVISDLLRCYERVASGSGK